MDNVKTGQPSRGPSCGESLTAWAERIAAETSSPMEIGASAELPALLKGLAKTWDYRVPLAAKLRAWEEAALALELRLLRVLVILGMGQEQAAEVIRRTSKRGPFVANFDNGDTFADRLSESVRALGVELAVGGLLQRAEETQR